MRRPRQAEVGRPAGPEVGNQTAAYRTSSYQLDIRIFHAVIDLQSMATAVNHQQMPVVVDHHSGRAPEALFRRQVGDFASTDDVLAGGDVLGTPPGQVLDAEECRQGVAVRFEDRNALVAPIRNVNIVVSVHGYVRGTAELADPCAW